jgi:uncharacterized protein GlcG (DUF336 family)
MPWVKVADAAQALNNRTLFLVALRGVHSMVDRLVPVRSTLSLEAALSISVEALRLRRELGLHPLAVVVLDAGAQLVSFQREDGCGPLRYDIALGKAWGALGLGMSSRLIGERTAMRPAFQTAVSVASQGRFVPVAGGVLILDREGGAIGAVGISGDTSDHDEHCAIEAIRRVGMQPDPERPVKG